MSQSDAGKDLRQAEPSSSGALDAKGPGGSTSTCVRATFSRCSSLEIRERTAVKIRRCAIYRVPRKRGWPREPDAGREAAQWRVEQPVEAAHAGNDEERPLAVTPDKPFRVAAVNCKPKRENVSVCW
jgi:hypothetical protein